MKQCKDEFIVETTWEFDSKVAEIFNIHVRQSIPFYDETHRMVCELSGNFLKQGSTVCDIGTSTGTAIKRLYDAYTEMELNFIGLDNSSAMLSKASEECLGIGGVKFIQCNAQEFDFPSSDLVLCIYTLQFIHPAEKVKLNKKIYDALEPGGAFILAEKIATESISFQNCFRKFHEDYKRRMGLSEREIASKRKSLQGVLIPDQLSCHLRYLIDCGYSEVEIFFKWYDFVGIVCKK